MELLSLVNRGIRRSLIRRGVSSEFIRLKGTQIHYYRTERDGRGPPLLWVHGLGSSANDFHRTLEPLATRFRSVFAVDLPGNGFSSLPIGGPMAAMEQVELLLEFCRTVIREPAFIAGNSLGGGMALKMAFQEPGAFRALGLICPAGAQLSDARFRQLVESFKVDDARGGRALANKIFASPPWALMLFADELRKMMSRPAVVNLVAELSPEHQAQAQQVRALTMPTLFIWGSKEKLLPYEGFEFFREHLPPHADIQEVRGFGHMPQVEHPNELVERMHQFALSRGLI